MEHEEFLAIDCKQATDLAKLELFRNINGLNHCAPAACEYNSKVILMLFYSLRLGIQVVVKRKTLSSEC